MVPNQGIEIDHPDILVVEGLNVLQAGRPPKDGKVIPFVSDFFDFSVYLDADEDVLRQWYVDRFLTFLRRLIKDARQKVFLIVDNLKVHHARKVKAWVER